MQEDRGKRGGGGGIAFPVLMIEYDPMHMSLGNILMGLHQVTQQVSALSTLTTFDKFYRYCTCSAVRFSSLSMF